MCHIKSDFFQTVHDSIRGSKGKIPWIEYNDVTIPDSQLIIEYLNKLRDVDLNRHLTEEQQAVAVAFQRMVDEHTYWYGIVLIIIKIEENMKLCPKKYKNTMKRIYLNERKTIHSVYICTSFCIYGS